MCVKGGWSWAEAGAGAEAGAEAGRDEFARVRAEWSLTRAEELKGFEMGRGGGVNIVYGIGRGRVRGRECWGMLAKIGLYLLGVASR